MELRGERQFVFADLIYPLCPIFQVKITKSKWLVRTKHALLVSYAQA
jgi:hypothetical protein